MHIRSNFTAALLVKFYRTRWNIMSTICLCIHYGIVFMVLYARTADSVASGSQQIAKTPHRVLFSIKAANQLTNDFASRMKCAFAWNCILSLAVRQTGNTFGKANSKLGRNYQVGKIVCDQSQSNALCRHFQCCFCASRSIKGISKRNWPFLHNVVAAAHNYRPMIITLNVAFFLFFSFLFSSFFFFSEAISLNSLISEFTRSLSPCHRGLFWTDCLAILSLDIFFWAGSLSN